MALQAWFPLNGNFKNQGVSSFSPVISSITNASWTEGKTGNNLTIANGKSSTMTVAGLVGKTEYTISLWVKMTANKTYGQWSDVISLGDFRLESVNTSGSTVNWFGAGLSDAGTINYTPGMDIWFHDCVVVNATQIKRYINGALRGTTTKKTVNGTTNGRLSLGDNNMYCSIADVRIYDECLSKKQIKELAKGLILHYPFDNYIGNPNLAPTYLAITNKTSEIFNGHPVYYLKYEGTSYKDCFGISGYLTPEANTEYTCSFYAKGNCQIRNFFYPNVCSKVINSENYVAYNAIDGHNRITLTSEWKKYWITYTTMSNISGSKNFIVGRIENQGTGAECYIAGVKFEKGNKVTNWCPNINDPLYTKLKYEDTMIYDTSSNGYNGTMSKQLYYTSDSPVGFTSLNLQGTDYTSYIRCANAPKLINNFTWSVWIKQNDATSPQTNQHVISQGRDYNLFGAGIVITSGMVKWYFGGGTGGNLILSSNYTLDSSWHMITCTVDAEGKSKIYIDGILKASDNTTRIPNYSNADGNLVIGKMSHGYTGTSQYFAYNGLISDFRIYATALSDTDILNLYQSYMSVDNKHNFYTTQINEIENTKTQLSKTGVIITNEINEDTFMKIGKTFIQTNKVIEK